MSIDVKELIQSGVHFGHKSSRWHPKMEPFIFGKRNQIHIIDLRETVRGILRASNFLSRLAGTGRQIVFVGTKRQEYIAVLEAKKLGIPVIGLVDTDCDPSTVDLCIPCNDDAYRAIQAILRQLTDAVIAGRDKMVTEKQMEDKANIEKSGDGGNGAPVRKEKSEQKA